MGADANESRLHLTQNELFEIVEKNRVRFVTFFMRVVFGLSGTALGRSWTPAFAGVTVMFMAVCWSRLDARFRGHDDMVGGKPLNKDPRDNARG